MGGPSDGEGDGAPPDESRRDALRALLSRESASDWLALRGGSLANDATSAASDRIARRRANQESASATRDRPEGAETSAPAQADSDSPAEAPTPPPPTPDAPPAPATTSGPRGSRLSKSGGAEVKDALLDAWASAKRQTDQARTTRVARARVVASAEAEEPSAETEEPRLLTRRHRRPKVSGDAPAYKGDSWAPRRAPERPPERGSSSGRAKLAAAALGVVAVYLAVTASQAETTFQRRLADKEEAMGRMEARLLAAQTGRARSEDSQRSLKGRVAELEEERDRLQGKLGNEQTRAEGALRDATALRSELDSVREDREKRLAAKEGWLRDARAQLKRSQETLAQVQDQRDRAQAELEQARKDRTEASQRAAAIEADLEASQGRLSAMASVYARLRDLHQRDSAEAKRAQRAADEVLAEAAAQTERARSEASAAQAQVADLTARVKLLGEELGRAKTQSAALAVEVGAAETRVAALQREVAAGGAPTLVVAWRLTDDGRLRLQVDEATAATLTQGSSGEALLAVRVELSGPLAGEGELGGLVSRGAEGPFQLSRPTWLGEAAWLWLDGATAAGLAAGTGELVLELTTDGDLPPPVASARLVGSRGMARAGR
jgi:hypothetical protein